MNALLSAAILALGLGPASQSAANVTVEIKNFAFVPAVLAVAPGTTVRFVNDDTEAHTVTAVDRSFDSAGLDTGGVWVYRFATPGKFTYFCGLHPYMHGTVVVRNTGSAN